MTSIVEKSRIKFTKNEKTGEVLGFVSRHSKTKKLKGVREDSEFGKQICVLSSDLKGTLMPNTLYDVELKAMHRRNGYVVVSATVVLFKAQVELVIVPKVTYQVRASFGNKTIYFDPIDGKTDSSKTLEGALNILKDRKDVEDIERVINKFKEQAVLLMSKMQSDGFLL